MTECDLSTEELFLILFCIVDDLYQEAAPDWVRLRNGVDQMEMTDPEIITLSIMQEGQSNDSELSFHRVVQKNYLHLFPDLICRSRYHRRRKDLMGIQREMLRLLMNRLRLLSRQPSGSPWTQLRLSPPSLLAILFSSLTVKVTDQELVFYFGPGFWTRHFALDDIIGVEVVQNSPLYGWGIRYTRHGWLYNVSGLRAVEVTVRGEGQIRIGTDEPEALKRALEESREPVPSDRDREEGTRESEKGTH